jgi:uncharacterized membrane protein YbhN (UPF0104 family)
VSTTNAASTDADRPRSRWTARHWLGAAVSVVLVVLSFGFLLPKLADYSDVWHTIRTLDAGDAVLLAALAVFSLLSLALVVVVALPGVRFREAFVNLSAGTAFANTIPAGSAIGVGVNWAIYDSWGFEPSEYTLASLLAGVWNNFVKLTLPIVALLILALQGELKHSFIPAAIIGIVVMAATIVVFALVLRSDRLAAAIGGWLGRVVTAVGRRFGWKPKTDWREDAVRFRRRSVRLIKQRWSMLSITAVVGQLSLYLVLLACVRAVDVSNSQVSWAEILASFAFVRLLSAIPVTPGGLGVVELGLTAALASGQSTAVTAQVTAAVLLFRALTYLLPIPVGVGCYIFWRANHSWRHTPEERSGIVSEE